MQEKAVAYAATYGCIVDEKVDVEAEGDWNGHQAHQFVQLYFTSLFPGQLLDLDPIGHLRDKALSVVLLPLLALVRRRVSARLLQTTRTSAT